MEKHIKKLLGKQEGSVTVLIALLITGLLGITALVIDGGTLYVTRAHLKKTANAAVLSGGQELMRPTAVIHGIVHHVLEAHQERNSLVNMTVTEGRNIRLRLKKTVPLTFARVLGLSEAPVEATAAATIVQMGRGHGAAPLGIDESIPLQYYREYWLKVDQTGVSSGNFGILALGGTGAQTYEDNLRYGYKQEVGYGDIIDTQTGNIAGKTRTVINELVNSCSNPIGDYHHRGCRRILLIPVYRPHLHETNQLKQIQVVGFAYFYILEPMSSGSTEIKGMFIEKVGTGSSDARAVIRGAYSIKLTG